MGFNKEKKPKCLSFTNQGGNKKSYVEALKSQVKKEESKKDALNSQDKNRNNIGHPICKLIKANIHSVQYKLSTQGSVLFQR